MARHLARQLPQPNPYEVICGVGLGSNVCLELWALLTPRPRRMILLDPAIEHSFEKSVLELAEGALNDPIPEQFFFREVSKDQPRRCSAQEMGPYAHRSSGN